MSEKMIRDPRAAGGAGGFDPISDYSTFPRVPSRATWIKLAHDVNLHDFAPDDDGVWYYRTASVEALEPAKRELFDAIIATDYGKTFVVSQLDDSIQLRAEFTPLSVEAVEFIFKVCVPRIYEVGPDNETIPMVIESEVLALMSGEDRAEFILRFA